MLSLVIPTYNEANNITQLLEDLTNLFSENKLVAEIIVVDDNSPDGTANVVRELQKKDNLIKLIVRPGKKGLASAVLQGFLTADGEILGVMDADFSHPPEAVLKMYRVIAQNNDKRVDFVIGSRYCLGGGISNWGNFRRLISKGAVLMARPFSKLYDPISGLFLIRKKCLIGKTFNPKGFKICLEFLVKAHYKSVTEVPYTFNDRRKGKSKAGIREYFLYVRNLMGYVGHKAGKSCS